MANAGVVNATGDAAPDAWRRVVALMIQSFEAPARGPLPASPEHDALYEPCSAPVRLLLRNRTRGTTDLGPCRLLVCDSSPCRRARRARRDLHSRGGRAGGRGTARYRAQPSCPGRSGSAPPCRCGTRRCRSWSPALIRTRRTPGLRVLAGPGRHRFLTHSAANKGVTRDPLGIPFTGSADPYRSQPPVPSNCLQ